MASIRDYSSADLTRSSPGMNLRAVTPHASDSLPDGPCKALWVNVGGDVSVIAEGDTAAVIVNVSGLLPVRVSAVRVTGTTASGIVAIY